MTGKEYNAKLFARKTLGRNGFWLGNPSDEAKKTYADCMNLKVAFPTDEEIAGRTETVALATNIGMLDVALTAAFESDMFWYSPECDMTSYKHPQGRPMWDIYNGHRTSLSQPGVLADCESVSELNKFAWPDIDYLDFSTARETIRLARENGLAVYSGMWIPFFHILCDLFGMENYFMKMYTNPKIVEAVTERVMDFYLAANERYLQLMAPEMDVAFFGNDLGSQLGLLISPDLFRKFILPGFARVVEQAHRYNLPVAFHCCGAISELIPDFIDVGIRALHPLQANARDMIPENLAAFKNDLIFIGGVDTQHLLPFCSADEVRQEVLRIRDILGEHYIVSPSHEALLPNVPWENVMAMKEAALDR